MIYLACPYSDSDPKVRESRFREVNRAANAMMSRGGHVFSPISRCHPISLEGGIPTSWEYWEAYATEMLSHCSELIVLMLDGWEESTGVQAEIKIAKAMELDILYWGTSGIKAAKENLILVPGAH